MKRTVNGVTFHTKKLTFESLDILEVEVGTTGFCGGDSGHGCRKFFRLADRAGTDVEIKSGRDNYGCDYVTIKLGGDSELATMIGALEFAVDELKKKANISSKALKYMGTVENSASWRQIGYIEHLCEEKGYVLHRSGYITKSIAGSIIAFLNKKGKQDLPEHLKEFLIPDIVTVEEKERRKMLGLPLRKN